jgi:OTU domain-containing protein 3
MAQKGGSNGKGGSSKKSSSSKSSSSEGGRRVNATKAKKQQRGCGDGKKFKSKNGRNYSPASSNDTDDATFRSHLLARGHIIREMTSDGNCLFRSISDQLYDDAGSNHFTVRSEICNHLAQNKSEFQSFLLLNEDDEDVMNIDDYVDHMRESTTWGSDIEIVAASRVYNRGIKVFSHVYAGGVLRFGSRVDDSDDNDFLLSYHGNDHYNSVHMTFEGVKNRRLKQQQQGGERYPLQTDRRSAAANSSSSSNNDDPFQLGEEKETSTTQSITATMTTTNVDNNNNQSDNDSKRQNNNNTTKLKKGSTCPCGSGLKYKKCCLAREKAKKRLAKLLLDDDDDYVDDDDKEKKTEEFLGEFKVLNI